jgi:hypothetical protein
MKGLSSRRGYDGRSVRKGGGGRVQVTKSQTLLAPDHYLVACFAHRFLTDFCSNN